MPLLNTISVTNILMIEHQFLKHLYQLSSVELWFSYSKTTILGQHNLYINVL